MQIAVRHSLQVFDPTDDSLREADAFVLPVRDAEAVMGETVAAYLKRVEWRFDLPTVCKINGEFYGRAEWETKALALNDNIEFISRPGDFGGGSRGGGAKSIMGVVALIALTVLAPYAVGAAGAAGATALGTSAATLTFAGKLAAAAIIGAGALVVSHFLKPKAGGKTNASEELYNFGFQGNAARPMQPIPVLNGRLKFSPDFAAPTYSECVGGTLTDHGDGLDRPSRLRARERSARAYRWAAPRTGGAGVGHGAEGSHPRPPACRGHRTRAERASRVFR